MRFSFNPLLTTAATVLLASGVSAQLTDLQPGRNFVNENNFGTARSENIDVGDADNDGDLDVIVGNGGDGSAQLNRIYINNGSASFTDETGTRFAGAPSDRSRDIEFMDMDDDGDLDIYVSNRGTTGGSPVGEVSRFFTNRGGLQAGPVGFYIEETDTRWGTLVSVPVGQQVFGGNQSSWRDWTCDCDFADMDDDGDLDLFHSSYGPGINGTHDSRIFLNDGAGIFDELSPWVNGAADIKTHTFDIDIVDMDDDFDLDIFMASRDSQARVFQNNLYNPISGNLYHDITQNALINQGATLSGNSNYEAEVGDVDGDGDFDVWAKNYNGFTDRILRNNGVSGSTFTFTQMNSWIQGDPNQDENEIDFGDFDGDGDLDAFVANFSGTNRLYQSGLAQGLLPGSLYHRNDGGSSQASGFPELPTTGNGGTSLDGEWGDLDGDGDEEILVANDGGQQNRMFRNTGGIPDTHAPTFHQITSVSSPTAGQPVVVHVQIRDNIAFYLTGYYDADLIYEVDGGGEQTIDMFFQGGQQWRTLIPAQNGSVDWRVEVTDMNGNTGVSQTFNYVQGGGGNAWTNLGGGLAGTTGIPSLTGTGTLVVGQPFTLNLTNAATSASATLFVSLADTPTPFKGGTLHTVPVILTLPFVTDGSGEVLIGGPWPAGAGALTFYVQYGVSDAGAIFGTAISNYLRADVP